MAFQDCWKYDLAQKGEKGIWEVVQLAGVSESTIIPTTQIREAGAGWDQMGMIFLIHDWRLKSETENRPTASKELYCSLFLPPQMHNWEGREQATGTSGNKDYYEAHPQRLT